MRLAILCLIALAGAAMSSAALAQGRWSAIAVGPKGVYGVAQYQENAAEARANALEACGATCTQVYTYNAGCASVAAAAPATPEDESVVAFDYSKFLGRAQFRALRKCSTDAENCEIVVTACARPGIALH